MVRQKKQVAGRKETTLVGAGDGTLAKYPPGERIYAPDDTEFYYYTQLFKGYFKRLSRWNAILNDEKYSRDLLSFERDRREKEAWSWSDFQVLQTPNGFVISPLTGEEQPERVFIMTRDIALYEPDYGEFATHFIVRRGAAGEQLLVDPEGKPLEEVRIEVTDTKPFAIQSLIIFGQYPYPPGTQIPPKPGIGVDYDIRKQTLRLERYLYYPLMLEEMATHLFDTIDSLIPNTTNATPQTEYRITPEIPLALPYPGRRPAGQ